MKKIIAYLSFLAPIFAQANVAELRVILEEDLAVQVKIAELKKEQKEVFLEMQMAMQSAEALIESYEAKTAQALAKNDEQNFKKEVLLTKLNALVENLLKKEENIKNLYGEFAKNLEKIPPSLREIYKKEMQGIANTSYANSSEENLAKLKFLSKVSKDANNYQVLDDNVLVFGLNAEFAKENASGEIAKLFKIIEGESSYEILQLKVNKGEK